MDHLICTEEGIQVLRSTVLWPGLYVQLTLSLINMPFKNKELWDGLLRTHTQFYSNFQSKEKKCSERQIQTNLVGVYIEREKKTVETNVR